MENKSKTSWSKIVLLVVIGLISFAVVFGATFFAIYRQDIRHTTAGSTQPFQVESGESVEQVGRRLEDDGLINRWQSFRLYAVLNQQTNLMVGHYSISSEMTIPEILEALNQGESETFSLTFLPGGTVAMAKQVLADANFDDQEVDAAFDADYSAEFPELFADKPAETDLEGYIYGETYNFDRGTSPSDVLRRTFSQMQTVIVEGNYRDRFATRGLNLYEGITLASIVQREEPGLESQQQVAGVFYNRMAIGMNLGSDPTYQYAADKLGVPRDTNLDSPYNTRIYSGLTPTPISAPGATALQAVADPISSDYLFFLSGDDDNLYFATTDEEHQQNIIDHCQEKCQIL